MRRNLTQIQEQTGPVGRYVRQARKAANLTQEELAGQSGVGLRFLRELELGKTSLRMDKVQQVLQFFGQELSVAPLPPELR